MLKQAAEANVQDDEVEGSRMRLYMKYPIVSTYTSLFKCSAAIKTCSILA